MHDVLKRNEMKFNSIEYELIHIATPHDFLVVSLVPICKKQSAYSNQSQDEPLL